MTLTIPDEILQQAGLATERETVLELACRLFDAEKLHLWPAAKLAGLTRGQMEGELRRRKIPIYRPTVEDLMQDLATLEHLREKRS